MSEGFNIGFENVWEDHEPISEDFSSLPDLSLDVEGSNVKGYSSDSELVKNKNEKIDKVELQASTKSFGESIDIASSGFEDFNSFNYFQNESSAGFGDFHSTFQNDFDQVSGDVNEFEKEGSTEVLDPSKIIKDEVKTESLRIDDSFVDQFNSIEKQTVEDDGFGDFTSTFVESTLSQVNLKENLENATAKSLPSKQTDFTEFSNKTEDATNLEDKYEFRIFSDPKIKSTNDSYGAFGEFPLVNKVEDHKNNDDGFGNFSNTKGSEIRVVNDGGFDEFSNTAENNFGVVDDDGFGDFSGLDGQSNLEKDDGFGDFSGLAAVDTVDNSQFDFGTFATDFSEPLKNAGDQIDFDKFESSSFPAASPNQSTIARTVSNLPPDFPIEDIGTPIPISDIIPDLKDTLTRICGSSLHEFKPINESDLESLKPSFYNQDLYAALCQPTLRSKRPFDWKNSSCQVKFLLANGVSEKIQARVKGGVTEITNKPKWSFTPNPALANASATKRTPVLPPPTIITQPIQLLSNQRPRQISLDKFSKPVQDLLVKLPDLSFIKGISSNTQLDSVPDTEILIQATPPSFDPPPKSSANTGTLINLLD